MLSEVNKLAKALKWLLQHLVVRTRDQNGGDPDAKPRTNVEIGFKGEF